MPATARNISVEHDAAAKGEIILLPNAKLPEEKLKAPQPWDSPTYAINQQQAQMLMLALNQMDKKEVTPTTLPSQAHQPIRLVPEWKPMQTQQQHGCQLSMSEEERADKVVSQLRAQQAAMQLNQN